MDRPWLWTLILALPICEYIASVSLSVADVYRWVFNTKLPSSSQSGHTIYDPTKSTTFQAINGATFNISYGDGSFALGDVGTDTVDIGGATVTQQAVELPTEVAASFASDTASNGLVGLAFSKLNTVQPTQQKTFFDNVQGDLEQPVFTANLKHGTVGAYEFGTIDSTQFQGSLTSVPIDSTNGFWQFTSQSIAVGSGAAMTVQGGSGTAIADTGTSLLIVDPAVVQAYWSQVQGAMNSQQEGGVVFPCSATLPTLSLAIGTSYMATISGSLLNFATAGTDQQTGTACEYLQPPPTSISTANLRFYRLLRRCSVEFRRKFADLRRYLLQVAVRCFLWYGTIHRCRSSHDLKSSFSIPTRRPLHTAASSGNS